MTQPNLGSMPIDLPKLLESRLLLVAGSGSGKSFALRRILEQTATSVQQLVIDPDGEFASLRERYDYIICAPSGADAVATPATAVALATALWKAGLSAVLDISDLTPHDRIVFVRRFFETLIAQPRPTWHSCLVVLDEAHLFAPQVGEAESLHAVIDIAARGRKRGLCLLAATQRLSKLHKDVAAETRNKMIGGMTLDIDLARAGDELGFSPKYRVILRDMEPGEFFVYGPALCREVTRTAIGPVVTTHPQLGQKIAVPPPPSAKIRAQLGKIEGLQLEAEADLKDAAALRAELTKVRAALTLAQKAPGKGIDEAQVQERIRVAVEAVMRAEKADHEKHVSAAVAAERKASQRELAKLTVPLAKARDIILGALGEGFDAMTREPTVTAFLPGNSPKFNGSGKDFGVITIDAAAPAHRPRETPALPATIPGLRSGAVRILAELAGRAPAGYTVRQVASLTGFAPDGGTFRTYMGDLKRNGLTEMRGNLLHASEAGMAFLGDKVPPKVTTHAEAMAMWRKALRSGAHTMLEVVVSYGADGIDARLLAEQVGMTPTGGTFRTYLGDLRRNGLIHQAGQHCIATDVLFPEA